jgi:hypothetical protein
VADSQNAVQGPRFPPEFQERTGRDVAFDCRLRFRRILTGRIGKMPKRRAVNGRFWPWVRIDQNRLGTDIPVRNDARVQVAKRGGNVDDD